MMAEIAPDPQKKKRSPRLAGQSTALSIKKTRSTAEARSKKGQFYKALPKQFCHDGFQYRQIAREGHAAVYEQRGSGCAERSVSYELIRVRRREGFRIDGRFVAPAEIYPKGEAWGVDGFTFTDKDAALARLLEMSSGGPDRRIRSLEATLRKVAA